MSEEKTKAPDLEALLNAAQMVLDHDPADPTDDGCRDALRAALLPFVEPEGTDRQVHVLEVTCAGATGERSVCLDGVRGPAKPSKRLPEPAWSSSDPPLPPLPDPPRFERFRGEGNPHPARVRLRDETEGAVGIGDVACPVPGCTGPGLACRPVLDLDGIEREVLQLEAILPKSIERAHHETVARTDQALALIAAMRARDAELAALEAERDRAAASVASLLAEHHAIVIGWSAGEEGRLPTENPNPPGSVAARGWAFGRDRGARVHRLEARFAIRPMMDTALQRVRAISAIGQAIEPKVAPSEIPDVALDLRELEHEAREDLAAAELFTAEPWPAEGYLARDVGSRAVAALPARARQVLALCRAMRERDARAAEQTAKIGELKDENAKASASIASLLEDLERVQLAHGKALLDRFDRRQIAGAQTLIAQRQGVPMDPDAPIPLFAADTGEVMAYACARCRNVMSEGYACGGYEPNDPQRQPDLDAAAECCRCHCGAITGPGPRECDACKVKREAALAEGAAKREAVEEDDAARFALRVREGLKGWLERLWPLVLVHGDEGIGFLAFPVEIKDVPDELLERFGESRWFMANQEADFGRGETPEAALADLRARAARANGGA